MRDVFWNPGGINLHHSQTIVPLVQGSQVFWGTSDQFHDRSGLQPRPMMAMVGAVARDESGMGLPCQGDDCLSCGQGNAIESAGESNFNPLLLKLSSKLDLRSYE